MANKSKHAERSRRSHRQNNEDRNTGLYRMASVINRKMGMRSARGHQKRGET